MIGVDPNEVAAIAQGGEARCRSARPLFALRVQPPQVAVVWSVRTRRHGVAEPLSRHDLRAVPVAAVEHEEAEAGQIFGVDPDPTAPTGAATHRTDLLPV